MENFKTNQKGITLMVLIITIVLMITLAAVTIEVGTGTIDESQVLTFVSYMQTIQTKVDFIAQNEDISNYGRDLSSSNKSKLQEILNSENESFFTTINSSYLRFFDSNRLSSDLEIKNIDEEIIIDFNTREVISLKGIKYEGEMYYTQYNLPGGQKLVQQTEGVTRIVSFGDIVSNINGLNSTFTIKDISLGNGTLSYGQIDDSNVIKWTTITNHTNKGEDVTTSNITESGVYYFKLTDNTSGKDNVDINGNYPSVEIRLTNPPKLEGNLTDLSTTYNYTNINKSENWAFATDKTNAANLAYYVWIPRFVYKLDDSGKLAELQFLRGTSDVTTSGTYINSIEWKEPSAFTNGKSKKTGVWVKVDTPNKVRRRHH